jgi:hypothetical protein
VGEKVRKKRRVFDLDALLGPDGLQKVSDHFPTMRWEVRPQYETRSLTQIVSMYKEWSFAMWPKLSFPMLLSRIEKLGSKTAVKEIVSELRYGEQVQWDLYRDLDEAELKKRLLKEQTKSANAQAIFNDYAAALQPGIRKAKGEEDADDGEEQHGRGFIDEDVNDDEFDKLFEKINGGGAAAAAANTAPPTAAAAAASSTGSTKATATAAYAAAKASREAAAQALEQRLKDGGNAWSAVASKNAANALAAAQQEAQAAADLAEGSGLAARVSGQKRRRAAILDDEEDEEETAQFAPLQPASSIAAPASPRAEGAASGASDAATTNDAAAVDGAASAAEWEQDAAMADALPELAAAVAAETSEPASIVSASLAATQPLAPAEEQPELAVAADAAAVEGETSAAADAQPVPSQQPPAPAAVDNTYAGGVEIEADADEFAAFMGETEGTGSQQHHDDAPLPSQHPAAEETAEGGEGGSATQQLDLERAATEPMDTAAGTVVDAAAAEGEKQQQQQASISSLEATQVLAP